jgi:hypothetical protein
LVGLFAFLKQHLELLYSLCFDFVDRDIDLAGRETGLVESVLSMIKNVLKKLGTTYDERLQEPSLLFG